MRKETEKRERRQQIRMLDSAGQVILTEGDREFVRPFLPAERHGCPQCEAALFGFLSSSVSWECIRHNTTTFNHTVALMQGLVSANQVGQLLEVLQRSEQLVTTIQALATRPAGTPESRLAMIAELCAEAFAEAPTAPEAPSPSPEPESPHDGTQAQPEALPHGNVTPITLARR